MAPRRRSRHPLGVTAVRTGLPLALVAAAVIVLIVGPRGLAPGLLMTAMFVIVADWIIRIAISSQTDRDEEATARRRFARSGRWPDDDAGSGEQDDAGGARDAGAGRPPLETPHRSSSHDDGSPASRRPRGRRSQRRP